jgi:hypothetical protein
VLQPTVRTVADAVMTGVGQDVPKLVSMAAANTYLLSRFAIAQLGDCPEFREIKRVSSTNDDSVFRARGCRRSRHALLSACAIDRVT